MLNQGRSARSLSAAWRRMRPGSESGLDSIGLLSKGDQRLLDPDTQERYYAKIIERYIEFVADAGECEELLHRLDDLNIVAAAPGVAPLNRGDQQQHISEILFSLRKLREGIVASDRADLFASVVYLFCIKLAIMARHPQSYYPALLHVRRRFLPLGLLSTLEVAEIAAYLVLDAACRKHDLGEAYTLREQMCSTRDDRLDAVLSALVHDNHVLFRREKRIADGYRARLMDSADDDMRMVTLKAFGRAYMSVELSYLETSTDQDWGTLKQGGVGWELVGEDKIMIRKPKSRAYQPGTAL